MWYVRFATWLPQFGYHARSLNVSSIDEADAFEAESQHQNSVKAQGGCRQSGVLVKPQHGARSRRHRLDIVPTQLYAQD